MDSPLNEAHALQFATVLHSLLSFPKPYFMKLHYLFHIEMGTEGFAFSALTYKMKNHYYPDGICYLLSDFVVVVVLHSSA